MNEVDAHTITPDLTTVSEGVGWKGSINLAKLAEKDGSAAIEFNRPFGQIVWIEDFEFNEGIIEFDTKGKSEPRQGSFVGVAFRVVDDVTFDTVYFRPFNFRSQDAEQKSHAVQYISSPEWPWDRLRAERTGQYEKPIEPPPDGDMWFHVKIVIEGRQISVYVNDAIAPSLQVTELSDRNGGSVGIWCYGYGIVANLQITLLE